jgi:hypothetical protein
MVALSALSITFRDLLDRVRPALPHRRIWIFREILFKCWQRTLVVFGDWSAFSKLSWRSELLSRDQPERFVHFCRFCAGDTPHEGFDELGAGWYAQICRCRYCGGQGMRVWPLVWW